MMYKRAAAVLEVVFGKTDYLIEGRFSATDIIVGYTINWGQEQGLLVSKFAGLSGALARKRALHAKASLIVSYAVGRPTRRSPLNVWFRRIAEIHRCS
jgi:glutathione S-transferase